MDAAQGSTSMSLNGNTYLRYSEDGGFMESSVNNWALALWVKPTMLVGVQYLFEEGGSTNGIALRLNNNLIEFATRNAGVQVNAGTLTFPSDNEWHHIAAVYQADSIKIYLDGVSGISTYTGYPGGAIGAHSGNGGIGYHDVSSAFGVAVVLPPTSETITSTEAAFAYEDDPNFNHGSCVGLAIENYTNFNAHPFIQFDLSSLDPGCQITSANLILTHSSWGFWGEGGGAFNFNAHRVTDSWSEGSECYASGSGLTWNSGGSSYDPTVYDTETGAAGDAIGTEYTFDLLDLVQDWVDGTYSNYGVAIVPATNSLDWFTVYSDDDPSGLGPRLELTVDCSAGDFFSGKIDDVKYYNGQVPSSKEIFELAINDGNRYDLSRSGYYYSVASTSDGCTVIDTIGISCSRIITTNLFLANKLRNK